MTTSSDDYENLLKKARSLLSQSSHEATRSARYFAERALKLRPETCDPHEVLAQVAMRLGSKDGVSFHLRLAADLSPTRADVQVAFGIFCLRQADFKTAVEYLGRAVSLAPSNGLYCLYYGICLLATNDRKGAALAFGKLLFIEPELLISRNVHVSHAFLKGFIDQARMFMQAHHAEAMRQIVMPLISRYGERRMARLIATFEAMLGLRDYPAMAPMHDPKLIKFFGLREQPYYERSEFPWLEEIERCSVEIRSEFERMQSGGREEFDAYFRADGKSPALKHGYQTDLVGSKKWSSFHLHRYGRIDENCARCPITAECLDSLPLAYAEDYMPEAFFSVLQPGAHIPPHFGLSNIRLAVHLPIIIPENSGIRVGEQTRSWRFGECLIFDDSYEHEAWNRDSSDRVVLIFEIWHPDLTPPEIEGLQLFFRSRASFLKSVEQTSA